VTRTWLTVLWYVGGTFAAPFFLAGLAALFLEVSQVAETAPTLVALSLVFLIPALLTQLAGIALKSSRDMRALRQRLGRPASSEERAQTILRHARIVTPRGATMLFMGVVFILAALAAKFADLSVVGVLTLFVFYAMTAFTSLVSAFGARTFEAGIRTGRGTIERSMVPAVVLSGDPAEERFVLRGVFVPPFYNLLVEDRLPVRLGTVSRYVVGSGATFDERVVCGRLRRSPRGLYLLGPADICFQDVLGLTRVSVAAMACTELKVLPRFRELVILEPPRSRADAPDLLARPHRLPTDEPFRFREYAVGDDTRRIAWKLSVRAGQLHVRQPETREVSTQTVLLVLDSYVPPGQMLSDAFGVEEVLDRLAEAFISLARELVSRGNRVTMVAAARTSDGTVSVETLVCRKGGHVRWQDLGARVCWQGVSDLPQLVAAAGEGVHAVVVSSRFQAPPPAPFAGASLTWVYLPPHEALGEDVPSLWTALFGPGAPSRRWFFRSPFPPGADEDGLLVQIAAVRRKAARLGARSRLQKLARAEGEATLRALIARGDTVYRLAPGANAHHLIGLSAGVRAAPVASSA
jgi:uncharacterized protein (DUF58 family)